MVYDFLANDVSFVRSEDASYRFWSPICKSFVIGGIWSGNLNTQNIFDEFYRKAKNLQGDKLFIQRDQPLKGYSFRFIEDNREALEMIWHNLGGKYVSPLSRLFYESYGYEDDATIMDEEIAEKLNKIGQPDIVGNERVLDCSIDNSYWEIEDYKDLIGKAWVVVIDYHN